MVLGRRRDLCNKKVIKGNACLSVEMEIGTWVEGYSECVIKAEEKMLHNQEWIN